MSAPSNIYDQHRRAFPLVAAYVVMDGAERRATIAIKWGASVSVFVHWAGIEMRRGRAGGGGYDRASAACAGAAGKMPADLGADTFEDGTPHHDATERARFMAFRAALGADDGHGWERRLREAGFTVWQAV